MNQAYLENGYVVLRNFFAADEIDRLKHVLLDFHHSWQRDNGKFYAGTAVNSAYFTSKEYLVESQRIALFNFIGTNKLMKVVKSVFQSEPCFMNTQFFNPVNPALKNYWHRDPQYHLSIDEHKSALEGAMLYIFAFLYCVNLA